MNEDEALDKFIDEMLTTKNLAGVDEEARGYLAAELKEAFLNLLNRSIIDAMPDNKVDELNKFLDDESKTIEDMQKFVAESGVDAKKITFDTMIQFRDLYLQNSEERESQNKVQEA